MTHRSIIKVNAKSPPIVELDSNAHAAYVRFSKKRVAETKVVTEEKCTVTIDMDADGEVIGVELVGVEEFQVGCLLKMAGVTAPKPMLDRASYVPAKLESAQVISGVFPNLLHSGRFYGGRKLIGTKKNRRLA